MMISPELTSGFTPLKIRTEAFASRCMGLQRYKYFLIHSFLSMQTYQPDEAENLWAAGEKAEREGNLVNALIYYKEAINQYLMMGMEKKAATLQKKVGDSLLNARRFLDATAFYRQSLNILHVYGSESEIGECYYRLGICHLKLGKKDDALRHFDAAEFYFTRTGMKSKLDEMKKVTSTIRD
jgi:tetratricopeptide (TPR) repeat protein